MKKVFEIWIDDDAVFKGFCGIVISKSPSDETCNGTGVTTFNFSEADLSDKAGYFYPLKGKGQWVIVKEEKDKLSWPSTDIFSISSTVYRLSTRNKAEFTWDLLNDIIEDANANTVSNRNVLFSDCIDYRPEDYSDGQEIFIRNVYTGCDYKITCKA